jgi:hypothetical protein
MTPALVILEAFDEHWDDSLQAATPTNDPTPRQRKAFTKLMRHLAALRRLGHRA